MMLLSTILSTDNEHLMFYILAAIILLPVIAFIASFFEEDQDNSY